MIKTFHGAALTT